MSKFSVYAIYLLFSILALIVVRCYFSIDGLYGQDSYEYLRFSSAISAGWESGHWPSGFFWPIVYPLFGALLTFVTSDTAFSLQMISVLSLAGTLIFLHRILSVFTRNERVIQLYLFAGVFLSPIAFRSSFLCMSDMLCVFLFTAHLFYVIQYQREKRAQALFLATLLGVLAVFTRYAAAPIVAITSVWLAIDFLKHFRLIHLIPVVIAIGLAVIPHLVYTSTGMLHFTKHPWLTEWNLLNLFRRSFISNDGHTSYAHVNSVFYSLELLHPRFFIMLIPLVIYMVKAHIKTHYPVVLIAALFYFVFLCGMPTQNTRFILLLVPMISILCFPGFIVLVDRIQWKRIWISVVLLAGIVLSFAGFGSIYDRVRFEKTILLDLSSRHPTPTVYSFDLDVALKGRRYEGEVKSMYDSVYSAFNKGDLVLFNATRFGLQWRGRSPMLNWTFLLNNYSLDTVKYYDQGWRLYEIR